MKAGPIPASQLHMKLGSHARCHVLIPSPFLWGFCSSVARLTILTDRFCQYWHYWPIFNIGQYRYANPECDNNRKKGFQVISCRILIQENKSQEISVLLNDSVSAKPSKLLFCNLSAKQLWQSYMQLVNTKYRYHLYY